MATLDGDQLSQPLLEASIGIEQASDGRWETSVEIIVAHCTTG